MADTPMLTVFSYDIAAPRNRRKVSERLEEAGVRVQKSVFEAMLTDRQTRRVVRDIGPLLETGDSLRVYAVSAAGTHRCQVIGGGPMLEDAAYYLL